MAHAGALYFAHPESTSARTNLTIHRSTDEGLSWPASVRVWRARSGSGYSGMTAVPGKGLAITFNQWPTNDTRSSQDGPGQRIVYTMIPFEAFT